MALSCPGLAEVSLQKGEGREGVSARRSCRRAGRGRGEGAGQGRGERRGRAQRGRSGEQSTPGLQGEAPDQEGGARRRREDIRRAETPAEIKAGLKTRLEHVAKSRAKEVLS